MLNRWLPAPFCTSCYLLKWFRLKIFGAKVTVLADSLTPAGFVLRHITCELRNGDLGRTKIESEIESGKLHHVCHFQYFRSIVDIESRCVICTLVPVHTSDHGLNLQTL